MKKLNFVRVKFKCENCGCNIQLDLSHETFFEKMYYYMGDGPIVFDADCPECGYFNEFCEKGE